MIKKIFLFHIIFGLSLSCEIEDKKNLERVCSFDNLQEKPDFLSSGAESSILSYTPYNENSLYLFRTSFERGSEACVQLLIDSNSECDVVNYYEYDLQKLFYSNYKNEFVYASNNLNPCVRCTRLRLTKTFNILSLNKLKEINKKTTFQFYSYVLYSPSSRKFYMVNNNTNSHALPWVEELVSAISYKENLYFDLLKNTKKTNIEFWRKFSEDTLFYKEECSKKYLIPSKEISLFVSGKID